jgi:hypothetical protein
MKENIVFAGSKERKRKERITVIGGEDKESHVVFSLISNKGELSRSSCTCSAAIVFFAR